MDREEFNAELMERLKQVIQEIADEKGITPDDVIRNAIRYLKYSEVPSKSP